MIHLYLIFRAFTKKLTQLIPKISLVSEQIIGNDGIVIKESARARQSHHI
jgi:hypothetical protein